MARTKMNLINKTILKKLFLLLMVQAAFSCSAESGNQSLVAFWKTFRIAAIHHDYEKLAEFTRFPLVVHGVTDDDVHDCDKRCSLKLFDQLLKQTVYVESGSGVSEQTTQELLSNQVDLPVDKQADGSHFRFQQFEFEKLLQGWRLTDAYLE